MKTDYTTRPSIVNGVDLTKSHNYKAQTETDLAVYDFIAAAGFTVDITAKGATTRNSWACDAWRVTFNRGQNREGFDYFTGTGHRVIENHSSQPFGAHKNSIAYQNRLRGAQKAVRPHFAGVLHSLLMDGAALDSSFIDWCYDYGYNVDSIKDRNMYDACCETGQQLRKLFTHAERGTLAELLQDY